MGGGKGGACNGGRNDPSGDSGPTQQDPTEAGEHFRGGEKETAFPAREVALEILEAMPEAVVCVDREARIVYLNQAAEELWGCRAREACGADMAGLMVPEDRREVFRQAFRDMASSTEDGLLGRRHRFPSYRKDGTPFTAEVSLTSFTHREEKYYLAVTRDVTEQQRTEESLRQLSERYRVLHDNARFAVFSYDRNLILTDMNQVVTDLLGYSEEELLGRNVLELGVLHPDDYPRVTAAMGQLFAGHSATREDLRFFRRDGSVIIAHVIGVPLTDERGEVLEIMNIAHDVTEQRRLEEELESHRRRLKEEVRERTHELEEALKGLERSERYFRALTENTYDLIAVLDEDLKIRYLSPSVKRVSGYTPEEVAGRSSLDFIHPEDVPSLVDRFTHQLKNGGVTERAEYRWRHKDGTYRWQEAVACNLMEDPAVRGIVVNARDITERREAETKLRESEERYRSLVETSPDAIVVTDLEGKINMVNRAVVEMLGYRDPEEVLGRNVLEFISIEDHARAVESMRAPTEGEQVRREEYIMLRKDGARRWVEISASLLHDASGKPSGFIGITRDITDSKRIRTNLETLNRTLLSLGHDYMNNISNIVLAGREILEARLARYGRIQGGRFEAFTSERPEDGLLVRENPENYLCYRLMQAGLNTPVSTKDLDLSLLEKDPDAVSIRPREILAFPVHIKGKPVGCLCFFFTEERDFTAADIDILIMLGRALAIEEDRWEYQESLREFVDIASHELRHPTALLSGYSQLLREQGGQMEEATRAEVTEAIISAADRLAEIADGLVHASLLERNRFTIRRSRQDLVGLARGTISEMEKRFPERNFRLAVKGVMGTCSLDPLRIHELLVILLENAVKFSPPDTEVEVEVEVKADPGGVLVSVLDRGKGVREENRERIFERFYQEEKALYHSEGLGLGLYLARRIAEAHGGRIWHEPRPGGGSVFRVFIPYL
ncbi:sensor histidine kinase [Candidatus Solincola sp.]|nr:PAS domain S-box protein [Actinomycetota bacterium]